MAWLRRSSCWEAADEWSANFSPATAKHGVDRGLHGALALDGEGLLRGFECGGTIGGPLVDRGPSLGSDERDRGEPCCCHGDQPDDHADEHHEDDHATTFKKVV